MEEQRCVVLKGTVAKTRKLGKRLRFADLDVTSARLGNVLRVPPPEREEGKPYSGNELTPLDLASAERLVGTVVEVSMRFQDWAEGHRFPSFRSDMRAGDVVEVSAGYSERVAAVNGRKDKTILRGCAYEMIEQFVSSSAAATTWKGQREAAEKATADKSPAGDQVCPPAKRPRTEAKPQPAPGTNDCGGAGTASSNGSAAGTGGVAALCRMWVYSGKCERKACAFRHELLGEEEEERVARLRKQQERTRVAAQQMLSEYHQDEHPPGGKHDKIKRCTVFAQWLVDTFSQAVLERGSGVVDVAGGKGFVCLQLLKQTHSKQLRTTVIDPYQRNTLMAKRHRKALRKLECSPPAFLHVPLDDAFFEVPEQRALFTEAGVVVGMHPDQATGAIVQHAVRLRRPFAVVPCCVFTRDFSERETPEGKPVETLLELIAWLSSHHPNMRTAHLPIEGRNRVLYMLPEDYDDSA